MASTITRARISRGQGPATLSNWSTWRDRPRLPAAVVVEVSSSLLPTDGADLLTAKLLPELLEQQGYVVRRGPRLDMSKTTMEHSGRVYPLEIAEILKIAERTSVFVVATAIYREGNHIDRDVVEIIQASVNHGVMVDDAADGSPDRCSEEEKRCAKLILGYGASPLAQLVVPPGMYSSDVAERISEAVVEACSFGGPTHGYSLS